MGKEFLNQTGTTTNAGAADNNTPRVILASDGLPAGTATIGATKDAGANWTQSLGAASALVATTDNTLTNITAAPTSGQKVVIDDVLVSADAACNVLFEEETSGTDLFRVYFAGAGTVQFTPRGKLKLATADKKVTSKASTTVNVFITILWHSEA